VSPTGLSAEDRSSLQTDLAGVWRDATEASLRYWGRLGRLAFESVAALVPLVAELQPDDSGQAVLPGDGGGLRTILVEAEAGQAAVGVFLVENTTPEQLSVPVSVSTFLGPDGREVDPAVAFRPEVIVLESGDQLAVQVAVMIDETLDADVRYCGEIGVPGLSNTRIPVVVRRRVTATASPTGRTKAKTRAS
jgi:hypothetical protein